MPAGVSACVSMTRQRPSGPRARSVAKNWMKPLVRPQVVAGAQEGGIAEDELVRDGARRQQPLRPVEVGEDRLEQARALDQGALERAPFLGGDDQRDEIDAPGLGRARRDRRTDRGRCRSRARAALSCSMRSARVAGSSAVQLLQQRLPVRLDGAAGRRRARRSRRRRPDSPASGRRPEPPLLARSCSCLAPWLGTPSRFGPSADAR